jgi:hypothetical protein
MFFFLIKIQNTLKSNRKQKKTSTARKTVMSNYEKIVQGKI